MRLYILSTSLVILCACSSFPDYQMGTSVTQMEQLQTHNPDATNNPPAGIVTGLDGAIGENIINSHRNTNNSTEAKKVEQDVEFSMGEGD